jgi:SAM-dependent methyltransferase
MGGSGEARMVDWARQFLACPRCKQQLRSAADQLICAQCGSAGKIENGILRFAVTDRDASIKWYRDKGGTHFFERGRVPYAMSSLDGPVYHNYLAALRPARTDALVIDVGAGDGRNTSPWLGWGFTRVIATDAIFASLARFRARLYEEHPEWLDHIAFIECDARQLPLCADSADVVLAIEVLYYLNEDYSLGLNECRRILSSTGRLLLSERSWEGAVLTRLLYGGVAGMLSMRESRDMWDGSGEDGVRSRCFTESELSAMVREQGLTPLESGGVSLLSVVLGYLRGEGKLAPEDETLLPQVHALLADLGMHGKMNRTHVVVAGKAP